MRRESCEVVAAGRLSFSLKVFIRTEKIKGRAFNLGVDATTVCCDFCGNQHSSKQEIRPLSACLFSPHLPGAPPPRLQKRKCLSVQPQGPTLFLPCPPPLPPLPGLKHACALRTSAARKVTVGFHNTAAAMPAPFMAVVEPRLMMRVPLDTMWSRAFVALAGCIEGYLAGLGFVPDLLRCARLWTVEARAP